MIEEVKGKTALITGASSGIGAAAARKLSSEGLKVILAARRRDRLLKVQADIVRNGGLAEIFSVNLENEDARIRLYEQTRHEHIDILINNAGIGWYGFFGDMPWETIRSMLAINNEAAIHLVSLFLPEMLKRKSGHIINMSSIAGSLPSQGTAMYSASKAFLDAFTTALYRETRGTGVHVSLVRPGAVQTEFFRTAEEKDHAMTYPMGNSSGVSTEYVAAKIWRLLQRPRRVVHIPAWLNLAPLFEFTTGWIQDLIGPVHLNWSKKKIL